MLERNINAALKLSYSDDAEKELVNHAFIQDKRIIATDGRRLLSIPVDGLEQDFLLQFHSQDGPNVAAAMPQPPFTDDEISINDINAFVNRLPTEEVMNPNAPTCEECEGTGTVQVEYEDKQFDPHLIEVDCPICDGTGLKYPNDKSKNLMVVPQDDIPCIIRDEFVYSRLIIWLRDVMRLLDKKSAVLQKIENHKVLFQSEGVQFLLMGLNMFGEEWKADEKYRLI